MTGPRIAGREPVRHDLLCLTGDGWETLLTRDPALAAIAGMRHWAEHRLPVMLRRVQPGDLPGLVPVAVSLPSVHGRLRLGFQVSRAAVAGIERPPTLRIVADSLPDRLRERARSVLSLTDGLGLMPRVFGSAMWQHVTGSAYLHERSDLDLLWDIPKSADPAPVVASLLSSLLALDATAGPRLDGEIVLDRTRAASWRELAEPDRADILVKTGQEVALMSRDRFLGQQAATC